MATALDHGLAGTTRLTARVAAYHNGREPIGEPDEIVEVDLYFEADGTQITDPDRIASIVAKQAEQAKENP